MDTQPSTEEHDGPIGEQDDWSYTSLQQVLARLIAAAALIVGVGVAVGLVTYVVRASEPPTYESVARFTISPNLTILSAAPADQIESIAALDRPIVNATVSELLQSGAVAEAAAEDAGLTGGELDEYDFDASEVPGAAIVRLSITGPDADTVNALAAAVRNSDESLASEFIGVFDVRSIDRAEPSSRRIAPSPTRDALAVALAAMIATGTAVMLLGRRVRWPVRSARPAGDDTTEQVGEADPSKSDNALRRSELWELDSWLETPADDPAVEEPESSASEPDAASGGQARRPTDRRQGAAQAST